MNDLPTELLYYIASYISDIPIVSGISRHIDCILEDYYSHILKRDVRQLPKNIKVLKYVLYKGLIPYENVEKYLIKTKSEYLHSIIQSYSPSLSRTVVNLNNHNQDYNMYISGGIVCELTKYPYKHHKIEALYNLVRYHKYPSDRIFQFLFINCGQEYTDQFVEIICRLCKYDTKLRKQLPQSFVSHIHKVYHTLSHKDCVPTSRRTGIYSSKIDITPSRSHYKSGRFHRNQFI